MSEVPKEPGRYLCRHSLNVSVRGNTLEGCPTIWIVYGVVTKGDDDRLYFHSHSLNGMDQDEFASYDWHRVGLPEGWV